MFRKYRCHPVGRLFHYKLLYIYPKSCTKDVQAMLEDSLSEVQHKTIHLFKFSFFCASFFLHLDPDPVDKSQCGSMRIRIRHTGLTITYSNCVSHLLYLRYSTSLFPYSYYSALLEGTRAANGGLLRARVCQQRGQDHSAGKIILLIG